MRFYWIWSFILLLGTITVTAAQSPHVWSLPPDAAHIKTVDVRLKNNTHPSRRDETIFPAIALKGSEKIEIRFDDLLANNTQYYCTILHCNADGSVSGLSSFEYLDGLDRYFIPNIERSARTTIPYNHYRFELPNTQMQFTKSGHYQVAVFQDGEIGSEARPVFVRNFIVYESLFSVSGTVEKSPLNDITDTHQRVNFSVNHLGRDVWDSQSTIKATVLQNGEWETAKTPVKPLFSKGRTDDFNYQDKFLFEGLNEARYVDIRTISPTISNIIVEVDESGMTHITLPEETMRQQQYFSIFSRLLNGFFIATSDFQFESPYTESDYVMVHFSLFNQNPDDLKSMHMLSHFSGFVASEKNRMKYDDGYMSFQYSSLIKQGVHNYRYVEKVAKDTYSSQRTEGNLWLTYNQYQIIVYYRPFGGRYDQIGGFISLH